MKVLVIYQDTHYSTRNTVLEHLYSFRKYVPGVSFHYFNVLKKIPSYLTYIDYDAVILHYSFLAQNRFSLDSSGWKRKISNLKFLKGYKTAIPQDEYDETGRLCEMFREHGFKTVFTCFERQEDYLKAYPPHETGLEHYVTVFTGYVENKELQIIGKKVNKYSDRPIDIGYRARKLPYYFGSHGQLKYQLADVFLEKLKSTNFIHDISNTQDTERVFFGKNWYGFLLNCKAFLGCEGGSSLLDMDGSIKRKVVEFTKINPDATFEEAEKSCFPGLDNNIKCFAISPRHFECVMTRTLQILVEGNYGGIFKPGIHYLELKRDFSNIDEILIKLKDNELCQRIIDQAYNDIILSGTYSYSAFANEVIGHIRANIKSDTNSSSFNLLRNLFDLRNFMIKIFLVSFSGLLYKPIMSRLK